jgi:hypothetical protein
VSRFLDPLTLEELTDTEHSRWRVVDHPFRYESDLAGLITVPIGFVTDLASVPRIPFIYDALGADDNKPACVHDWIYTTGKYPKDIADKILLEASAVIGMAAWRRRLIYWGVVLFGDAIWDAHRRADKFKPAVQ